MSGERTMRLDTAGVSLEATLEAPDNAAGIVLFAHGSGSSRFSPRNRFVAEVLRGGGLATLLLDLLTPPEEAADAVTHHIRFDIELLSERLVGAIDWIGEHESIPNGDPLPVGLFGASTGAGAALVAAAQRPRDIRAVVSRGGRPDLAGDALRRVSAPTLMIVGGMDDVVIKLNRQAMREMQKQTHPPEVRLEIVPGATHLFEERGTLEQAALLARDWFVSHLHSSVSAPTLT